MKRLAPIFLILGLASPAFAQQVSPPAVIGPVFEPESLRSFPGGPLMTGPRIQRLPAQTQTPEDSPSISEFVRSLTTKCDPDRKPGDPAESNAPPACISRPNEDFEIIRPPFAPSRPDLHPDYGKLKQYPLTPL